MRLSATFISGFIAMSLFGSPLFAEDGNPPRLSDRSLEELMNIEVSTITKRKERVSQVPDAIFVLTQEDIRRSGAQTLPDLLRLVPGFQVAQIDANKWAVSSRGFNGRFSSKVLILIDGRMAYTPLFSGVFWEFEDVVISEVERIEVIRGPAGTLWGANATNGVVNVVTKHSSRTQGGQLAVGAGTETKIAGTLRYGGKIGETGTYRIYTKYFDRMDSFSAIGADDDWQMIRLGSRTDWRLSGNSELTAQGEMALGRACQRIALPLYTAPYFQLDNDETDLRGGNFLARWTKRLHEGSDLSIQTSYHRMSREAAELHFVQDIVDFDFRHNIDLPFRQNLIWGAGYRFYADRTEPGAVASLTPADRTLQTSNFFFQDQFTLVPDRLKLTGGIKFEHGTISGYEVQPSGQIAWTPTENQTLWASVSRAVRTPSRAESDITVTSPADPTTGVFPKVSGNPNLKTETLLGFELGYRRHFLENFMLDIASFVSFLDNITSIEPGAPAPEASPAPAHTILPIQFANNRNGRIYGFEVAAQWQAFNPWKISAGYNYLNVHLDVDSGSADTFASRDSGVTPLHQFVIRSFLDLPANTELDLTGRYVDELPAYGIPRYFVLDARLAWKARPDLEFAVVGRNLLKKHHPEFGSEYLGVQPTETEQSLFGKVTWKF